MRKKKNYYKPYGGRRINLWKRVLLAVLALGIALFCALEIVIAVNSRTEINGEPEVMGIFGCQVKPWGPSVLLQDRLDTALEYLETDSDITIVVTGGKGDDEHVSEARCMYDYLIEHGGDKSRIIMEDMSRNTSQNIQHTKAMLNAMGYDLLQEDYLLVSNGFHLARIKMLWGDYGTVSTLAAPSTHLPSRVKMFFREPLALVKSFVFDR